MPGTLHLQVDAVFDAGRDVNALDFLVFDDHLLSVARLALVGDEFPRAVAVVAFGFPDHGPKTGLGHFPHPAGPLTRGTNLHGVHVFGARSLAIGARHVSLDGEALFCAEEGFFE